MNDDGKCEIVNFEKCVGSFIIRNISNRMVPCRNSCYQKNILFVYFGIVNNSIVFDPDINNTFNIREMYYILYNFNHLNEESKKIILDIPICYNISSDENIRTQFEGCEKVIYIPNNKSYACFECDNDYILDSKTHKCQKIFYNYDKYKDCIDPILDRILELEKGIELNTGAIRYGMREMNPCMDILKKYREMGGEIITIGSDAHETGYLADGFDRAAEVLKECGFKYYTTFEKRVAEYHKLV